MIALPIQPKYPIRTARLDLRPHRESDLDDLFAFHSKPEVVEYVPWPVRTREQTKEALEQKLTRDAIRAVGDWLVLAMELRETGTVIGEVLLKYESDVHRSGEIGFAMNDDYHGQGLAFEAAEAMLRFGFEEMDLHRIVGICISANTASATLMRRLGMREEAHLVESVWWKGAWADDSVFALLADEWSAHQR